MAIVRARQTRHVEHILAERTLTVELDGQPTTTLRVVVGVPVMVSATEYRTDMSANPGLHRIFHHLVLILIPDIHS